MQELESNQYYIAYGSNLNIRQMEMRCPTATVVGAGEIKNYQLLFKGSKTGAYATIEEREGASVPIGIWSIDKQCEESLDRYEGYPNFYKKHFVPIQVGTGVHSALIYIMPKHHVLGMPSKHYLDVIAEGYQDFALEVKALNQAVENVREQLEMEHGQIPEIEWR